ncbi:STM3941 family protein [Actinomyces sp. zg328]|uniref:STM3941 family protein n=1 Tax=Actinomyces sp. zg328 TaxID=2609287 RepID=UPI00135BB8E2|nr:STM3941 family protein [Actinomyces sp. zg328]
MTQSPSPSSAGTPARVLERGSQARSNDIRMIAIALAMLCAGIVLMVWQPDFIYSTRRGPVLGPGLLVAGVVGALAALVSFVRHEKGQRPRVVIDDRGVHDATGPKAVGLIPWEEIAGLRVVSANSGRNEYVHVFLHHPEQALAQMIADPRRRQAMLARASRGQAPIAINSGVLGLPGVSLATVIREEGERRVGWESTTS